VGTTGVADYVDLLGPPVARDRAKQIRWREFARLKARLTELEAASELGADA
jgi:hypothetical protein